MKLKFFGDSYDILKKSFIASLGEFGEWSTHPMFTEQVSEEQAEAFAQLLNTTVIKGVDDSKNCTGKLLFHKFEGGKSLP